MTSVRTAPTPAILPAPADATPAAARTPASSPPRARRCLKLHVRITTDRGSDLYAIQPEYAGTDPVPAVTAVTFQKVTGDKASYRVVCTPTGVKCTCPAGLFNKACKHADASEALARLLSRFSPPAPAAEPAPVAQVEPVAAADPASTPTAEPVKPARKPRARKPRTAVAA